MLLLTSTSDNISIITGGSAVVATHASWMDSNSTNVVPGRQDTIVNTPTTTIVVPAPGVDSQHDVKTLVVSIDDDIGEQVTVVHTDGLNAVVLVDAFLAAGATLMWLPRQGWSMMTGLAVSRGAHRTLPRSSGFVRSAA
jgi:hypothetical protein